MSATLKQVVKYICIDLWWLYLFILH